MSSFLTSKYKARVGVFIITTLGSIWLFREQVIVSPRSFPTPPTVFHSSKFTRISKTPVRRGSRYDLQFINEKQGWIAQGKDLWQTWDGGKTWYLVYRTPYDQSGEFQNVQFTNANDGWAIITNNLYKTADGGTTWTRAATPMDDRYGSLWAFHLENGGKTGWIAGGVFQPMKLGDPCMNNATGSLPDSTYACLKGAVFRTDDGGLSWHPQNIPQFVGRFISITFIDPEHVWVAGDAGVYHTTDGGLSWSSDKFRRECEDYYELPDRYPAATLFADDQNGWLVLSSGQIAKSNDGGKTWCDLFDPETLWPSVPNYVGPTPQFRKIHFKDESYGVGLGHERAIYETLDGGATWRLEGTGLKFDIIVFSDNANGWAIAEDRDLYRVRLDDVAPDLDVPREEPRQLIDIFGADSISYQGYVVSRFNELVRSDDDSDLEVSYAALMKNGRRVLKFGGFYFGGGNDTEFGLFELLGRDSEQLIVSQTVPRGGRHWVVRVTPDVRVLFDSAHYGVGREEFYVIDIDKDDVYEIVLPVTAFYSMQDKMYIGEIPLTEIIFKYDAKAQQYLPANDRFLDYSLHGIERDIKKLRDDGKNYLSQRLSILLRYVYAGKAKEGWAFFDQTYQREDREEIVARIRSVLKKDPLYNSLYSEQR